MASLPRLLFAIIVAAHQLTAGPLVVDFESFVDGEFLATQLPGYTFSNTIIYTSAVSLNETDFPPRSGGNVASDFGGAITLLLDVPLSALGAYFTYGTAVSLTAFDALNNPVATANSLFTNNIGTGGDPGSTTNEFIQVSFVSGFTSVVIAGNPAGGSFVFDDLTLTDLEGNADVPEPSTAPLTVFVVLAFVIRRLYSL